MNSIAAILCMHGNSSKYLMKSVEMILGNQNNFDCINFSIGESIEILNNYYISSLKKLDIKNGVLCMVDIWGGSPFNVACQVFNKLDYKYSIVSGVNIPMLIDFFMIRDKLDLLDVTKSIVNSGKIGINNLN